jgi:RNA polymerase primary sigma factor/RNA polymerase sigma factor
MKTKQLRKPPVAAKLNLKVGSTAGRQLKSHNAHHSIAVPRDRALWSAQNSAGIAGSDKRETQLGSVPPASVTVDEKTRLDIFHLRRDGDSLDEIADRYGLTKARVSRILSEEHMKHVAEFALDFIPNDNFPRTSPGEEREILGPLPENLTAAKKMVRPTGLPPYLASMYETPLLTREQEQHLFRRMNYLKFKASSLRARLDEHRPSMAVMQQIARLYEQAVETKNDIVRANLRLVISIAKRYATGPAHLFELISDGNMSLIRAVEKFDFARGFRFSTYATWAIMKNFARTIPAELRVRARFHSGGDEQLQVVEDIHPNAILQESAQNERQDEVARILEHLNDREKQIIQHRFGLNDQRNAMTLKEVGRVMGVTKERIRQLEARAMAKLREAVGKEHVEVPDGEV